MIMVDNCRTHPVRVILSGRFFDGPNVCMPPDGTGKKEDERKIAEIRGE